MLDKVAILTKGGIVLWSTTICALQGVDPIDSLIKTVLLEVNLSLCFFFVNHL